MALQLRGPDRIIIANATMRITANIAAP